MITFMKCPICGDPVDEVHHNEEDGGEPGGCLMVTEHWDDSQETYESELKLYMCHSDHTFYMNPGEILIPPTNWTNNDKPHHIQGSNRTEASCYTGLISGHG